MKRTSSLLALVCCTALWSGTAHADPLYPEADLQLTQSSTTVAVNQSLTIHGGGAKAGADFTISCDTIAQPTGGGEQQLAAGVAGLDGSFEATITIPNVLTPGVYECRVITTISIEGPSGLTSGRSAVSRPAALADEVRQQSFEFIVLGSALPATGQDSDHTVRIAVAVTLAGLAVALVAYRRRRLHTA